MSNLGPSAARSGEAGSGGGDRKAKLLTVPFYPQFGSRFQVPRFRSTWYLSIEITSHLCRIPATD